MVVEISYKDGSIKYVPFADFINGENEMIVSPDGGDTLLVRKDIILRDCYVIQKD